MTIYGDFFITCTKCGWHSEVEIQLLTIECHKCGAVYESNSKEEAKDTNVKRGKEG
jgi:phage FluMu protein Com